MRKDLIKKLVINSVVVVSVGFVAFTLYAMSYVGDRNFLYPREEYSWSELAANRIKGYSKPYTISELKEKNLIAKDAVIKSISKSTIDWYSESSSKIVDKYKKILDKQHQENKQKLNEEISKDLDRTWEEIYKDSGRYKDKQEFLDEFYKLYNEKINKN